MRAGRDTNLSRLHLFPEEDRPQARIPLGDAGSVTVVVYLAPYHLIRESYAPSYELYLAEELPHNYVAEHRAYLYMLHCE